MTQPPNPELLGLLRQLGTAATPLERLRTLALAWRTVRGLKPAERLQLATALGVEGAGELVERLAQRKGGLAPTALLEAIHATREADPAEVARVVQDLGDAEERGRVLRDGLHAVEERLAGTPAPPLDPPIAAADDDQTSRPVASPPDEPTAPPAPVDGPRSRPDEVTGAQRRPTTADPPPPPPPAPAPPVRPAAPTGRPAGDRTSGAARPLPSPPSAEPLQKDGGRELEPRARPAAPTLVHRLRRLRRALRDRPEMATRDLRSLLDELPGGWPRRRGLGAALSLGLPRNLDDALEFVDDLGSPASRRWCLAALVDGRSLRPSELDRVLERATSRHERRRLTRRARR